MLVVGFCFLFFFLGIHSEQHKQFSLNWPHKGSPPPVGEESNIQGDKELLDHFPA